MELLYTSTSPSNTERNLTPVRLWRNQKEILKLHTLGRRSLRQPNALTFPEEKRHRVPQLHTSKVDTDA